MVFKHTHVKRYRLRVQLYYVGTPEHICTFVHLYNSTRDCTMHRAFAQLYNCTIAQLQNCTIAKLHNCAFAKLQICTILRLHNCTIASRHKAGAKVRRMELIQTPGHAGQLGGTLYMVIIARMTFKTNLFKD